MLQDSNAANIDKQIREVTTAILKMRELEKHLAEIKRRVELNVYIANEVLKKQDPTLFTKYKQELNIISSCNEFEKLLLLNQQIQNQGPSIISVLNPFKEALEKKVFLSHHHQSIFNTSKQHFFEEFTSSILRESQLFRSYKVMQSQYNPVGGAFEISYEHIKECFNLTISKFSLVIARFHKADKIENLPEIFHETIIRPDLLTITFTFKKLKPKSPYVFVHKIIYSNLFDNYNLKNIFRKENESSYISLQYAKQGNIDPEVLTLVNLIKKNSHKIILPCLYPSSSFHQFFSSQVMEKVEQLWKAATLNPAVHETILTSIIKKYPDDLAQAVQNKCYICKKMMKCDTFVQKLLPCIWWEESSTVKNEKWAFHNPCKKVAKYGKEIDEPKIILNLEVKNEDEEDVNKFLF